MTDHKVQKTDLEEIMVVDDTADSLKLLAGILTDHGYGVRPASSGRLALRSVVAEVPDLILLDVKMPDMNGYEVCRRLKADEKSRKVPVIFISALDEVANKVEGFSAGGVDYITKPFEPNEVLARVKTHLSLRQMQKRLEQAHRDLEDRVRERTAELAKANEDLHQEITNRKRAEEALHKAHDVLEAKVAERTRELTQANIRLQEMDRLKSVFLASMSHELRTPLNSIIGFTGIILQGMAGDVNEEQRKQLTMVGNSADHLLSLIDDVLDISKIEEGRLKLSLEEFGLIDVMSEVVKTLSPAASEKSLELLTEVPEGITLFTDRRRIKQVLMNLGSNAVKFTDQGSVKIAASVPGDGNLQISVIDSGVGIKKEDMDKLFQPFQRVGMSLAKSYTEGTGLGLYLTKKVIDLLGGDISAKSEYGRGSEFTLTVPLKYQGGQGNGEDTGSGGQ